MFAFQLFQQMPAALAQKIIAWMRGSEREVYRATVASLAQQKKLRPVFITKRPAADQASWIIEQLSQKLNEPIGENLLQIWLMKAGTGMLTTFLDEVGIPHDGKGGIEADIPKELDAAKVKSGVEKLVAANDPSEVAVYLNLFQLQQPGGWQAISDVLAADARLKFAA